MWCEYVFILCLKTACVLLCSAIVLYCHFCVLSLTGVTLPALLSQWSYVLWRNSSSCLTVKRLNHPSFVLYHLFVNRLKILIQKRRPRSFLHFSLTLDCSHVRSYIVNLLCSSYILVWQICMKHKVSLIRYKVVDARWLLQSNVMVI